MKKQILLALALILFGTGYAQKNVPSKIKEVTVFLNGAQVYRTASASLTKGRTEVVFSGLSRNVDPRSIQVKGNGKFSIMSVRHQLNYLKKARLDKRIKEMQDSVKLLQSEIDLQGRYYSALNQEAEMLLANKAIGGANSGVDVAKLKELADFYRSRLKDIYARMYQINKENSERKLTMRKLQQQINQSRQNYQTAVSEIVVDLNVEQNTQARFNFNYLVHNAGWYPQYDIRAIDAHHPVDLHYHAMVRQNTGVEWKNVKLTISTGNPSANGVIPELSPWYLNYYIPALRGARANGVAYDGYYADSIEVIEMEAESAPVMAVEQKSLKAKSSANYTKVQENQTAALFKISIPYTIPSSNKTVNVEISKVQLPAEYRYYCAPKYALDAFLQARITGWEELNLLPGAVNIFFEGTFVGKSRINPRNLEDTLNISLGKDPSIVVSREKIKDKTGSRTIGSNKKMNVAWEISVRNGKKEKINLIIQDQIPLSRNKEIEVSLNEQSGASLNPETGFLTWKIELAPSEKAVKRFDYTIKYPKKYVLSNQW